MSTTYAASGLAAALCLGVCLGVCLPSLAAAEEEIPRRKLWVAETTTTIDAPAALVFDIVADFHTWADWTAWSREADPTCQWTFTGAPGTVGHNMVWDGEEMGIGKMEYTEVSPHSRLEFDLFFDKKQKKNNPGYFTFTSHDGKTEVVWYTQGKLGLFGRMFRKKIERMVTEDFTEGLANLKVMAEKRQSELPPEPVDKRSSEDGPQPVKKGE